MVLGTMGLEIFSLKASLSALKDPGRFDFQKRIRNNG
jgi:hypothetical protein